MAVIRANKNRDFSIVSNHYIRDKNLSLKAKGLLTVVFTLPDDWDYSTEGLIAICKEGKEAITSVTKELKEFSYLKIIEVRNDKGQFEYVWEFFEKPNSDNQNIDKPTLEKPNTEKPYTVNPPQYNTNKSNTNILNTKELRTNNNYSSTVIQKDIKYNNYSNTQGYYKNTDKEKNTFLFEYSFREEDILQDEVKIKRFKEFKDSYPKKDTMDECCYWFYKTDLSQHDFDMCMAGLKVFKRSSEWKKENGRYIPKPIKYLEERMWELKRGR